MAWWVMQKNVVLCIVRHCNSIGQYQMASNLSSCCKALKVVFAICHWQLGQHKPLALCKNCSPFKHIPSSNFSRSIAHSGTLRSETEDLDDPTVVQVLHVRNMSEQQRTCPSASYLANQLFESWQCARHTILFKYCWIGCESVQATCLPVLPLLCVRRIQKQTQRSFLLVAQDVHSFMLCVC